eukprot:TsM_001068700 transcript=TsM_001068700 gene=TsM_001068700
MESEVRSHSKKITDLRMDLIEMLCKYLGVADIVNVCIAIPSWEWILSLEKPYSYINKWKWIDRRVCTTLHSKALIPRTADFHKAVEQHFGQMQFDLQFSSIRAPLDAYERVTCLLYLSILAKRANVFYPMRRSHVNRKVSLNVVSSTQPTSFHIRLIDCRRSAHVYYYPPGSSKLQIVSSKLERSLRSRKAQFAVHDCILYVLEHSQFTSHGSNILIELQAILRVLSPRHTFGIVIIDDVRMRSEGGMDLFLNYADKLGFVGNSPLKTALMNWRIWHVQECRSHIMKRMDIFEWVCQDVIWRRMQGSAN